MASTPTLIAYRVEKHLHDLIRIDNELLAEQRAGNSSCTNGLEVLKTPLKVFSVGKHGQAGCTPPLVAACDLHRVEVRLNHALAG